MLLTTLLLGTLALAGDGAGAPGADDPDVALIPSEVMGPPAAAPPVLPPSAPPAPAALQGHLYMEEASTFASAPRALAVAYPSDLATWQLRLSTDASGRRGIARGLALAVSGRVNLLAQTGAAVWSSDAVGVDLREAYLTWEPIEGLFTEVGRVNVRNGVALGFNPTDFFRAGSLVGQPSLDPSVVRENRLGTVMARAQAIWRGAAVSVAYAPKLYEPPRIARPSGGGLDVRLDATNWRHRLLCTLDLDVAQLSPQLLAELELDRARFGLSLSRPLGDSVVAYGEWAGGVDEPLLARAFDRGRASGELPSQSPPLGSPSRSFQDDLAVGASWANGAARLTLNLEYHLHQGGLSRADWASWFDGSASRRLPPAELWYVRAFAHDELEPVTSQAAFARVAWQRAFVDPLELTGLAYVDLLDGSTLAQLSAAYDLGGSFTLAAYLAAELGARRSEWGSMPQVVSGTVQLRWYAL